MQRRDLHPNTVLNFMHHRSQKRPDDGSE